MGSQGLLQGLDWGTKADHEKRFCQEERRARLGESLQASKRAAT